MQAANKLPGQFLSSKNEAGAYPAREMVTLLSQNAERFAGKDLYLLLEDGINETARITHDEAFNKARIIAGELQKHGSKGERVLLLFPTGLEFVVSLFACFLSGLIAVPAYPPHRKKANQRFLSILNDAKPAIILTTDRIRGDISIFDSDQKLVTGKKVLVYEELNFDRAEDWVDPKIGTDDIALLQYTSGSTGRPRGVIVSHANIIHNSECIRRSFGFDENLIGMNWLPNFHDMGLIGCLIQPAYVGGMNIIIPPLKFLQQPLNWFKNISKYKATNAGGPNFSYEYCIDKINDQELDDLDLSTISTMFCGAEPIRKKTLDQFTAKFGRASFRSQQFYPCYGLAESVLIVTGGDFRAEPIYLELDTRAMEENKVIAAESGRDSRTLTACGYPWLGMSVTIVNPETKIICPKGEIGEIWAKGPSITQGYWDNAEETEKTFKAYLEGTEDGPWLRTGDLGFIHEGQLYVSGRMKDLIIIRGSNFFPNDIEHSVENCHEALRQNAGTAFSAEIGGEEKLIIIQEVERTHMHDFDEDEVFEAIRNAIYADHGIQPNIIILVRMGSIKKTSSGKTQRFAMRTVWANNELNILASWEMAPEKENVATAIGFRPEFLREWMINWMAQKLELDPGKIDADKPISAYGLDSITAV
ncbi:MAG: AMP-binding protein, partial [Bacteroidales bacterium]|nr:AMP-binding protein [Bacteroidales bacterium]